MLVFWGTPQGRVILLTGVHGIETRAASADNSKLGAYMHVVLFRQGFPVKTNHFSGEQTMHIYGKIWNITLIIICYSGSDIHSNDPLSEMLIQVPMMELWKV